MPLWSRGQKGVVEDSWLIALSCVCVSDVRGRLVPCEMVIAPRQRSSIRPVLRGGVLVVVILVVVIVVVVVVVVVGLLLASMVSRRGGCQVSLSSRSSLEC